MESYYDSSTPSPTDTFPSPCGHFGESAANGQAALGAADSEKLLRNFDLKRSELYGPFTLQSGDAMIVPADQSNPGLQQQTKQDKRDEVKMLARMADLPLACIDGWSYDQKLTWMKCMLTLHVPQPDPQQLSERIEKLQAVEDEIASIKEQPLKAYIATFSKHFDQSFANKLYSELLEWHTVSATFSMWKASAPSFLQGPPAEKVVGDHLWEHILRLLMNQDLTVEWLDMEAGLFKFVDSSGAARSWGMTKGNQNMSYEKMSRSIRQYYTEGKNGIIQKAVEFPKLHYRFNMYHPEVVNFLRKNFLAVCQEDPFLSSVVNSVC